MCFTDFCGEGSMRFEENGIFLGFWIEFLGFGLKRGLVND